MKTVGQVSAGAIMLFGALVSPKNVHAQDPITIGTAVQYASTAIGLANGLKSLLSVSDDHVDAQFQQVNVKLDELLTLAHDLAAHQDELEAAVKATPSLTVIEEQIKTIEAGEALFTQTFAPGAQISSGDRKRANQAEFEVEMAVDRLVSYGYKALPGVLAGALLVYRYRQKLGEPAASTDRFLVGTTAEMESWISTTNATFGDEHQPTLPAIATELATNYKDLSQQGSTLPHYACDPYPRGEGCGGRDIPAHEEPYPNPDRSPRRVSCVTGFFHLVVYYPNPPGTKSWDQYHPENGAYHGGEMKTRVSDTGKCQVGAEDMARWVWGFPGASAVWQLPNMDSLTGEYDSIQQNGKHNLDLQDNTAKLIGQVQSGIGTLKSLIIHPARSMMERPSVAQR